MRHTINSHAAAWVDGDGNIDHVVLGSTSCERPRAPKHLAAATDDGFFEHVLRCRDCDGCRRYECLLLRRRLAEHFKSEVQPLWLVIVQASIEKQSGLRAKLYRTRNSCDWFGFFRLGQTGFALIARGARPTLYARGCFKSCAVKIIRLRTPARARAWRVASAGVLISRSTYGQNRNRFYVRGLARVKDETFAIMRAGGIRKRHPEAKGGMLAWRDGLVLMPSDRTRVASLLGVLRGGGGRSGATLTVNRQRPKAAVPGSVMTGFRDVARAHGVARDASTAVVTPVKHARATTFLPDAGLNSIKYGGDASSKHSLESFASDWLSRMLAKSRGAGG